MAKNKASSGKKKYVIYTRCSTDDQAQGDYTTLDAQAHHCQNMLDAFGYELADFGNKGVVNDDGYSGKDLNRPGIQSILNSVNKKRTFDGVIFFRLDRLTRNPRDLYALIDLFKAKDIDFISVRENLDSSTAIGRVVIGILGLLSAFERELTGERVKASAIARVRQGRWVGGFLPYGYKQIDDGEILPSGKQPRKIVIDEEVAQHLRVIWEMAANNRSLTEIGVELSKRGIKTPQGKEWRRQSLSNMIKNPFYKGYLHYAGETHKGLHPAIVDEKLWAKANKILVARLPGHHFNKKIGSHNYLLSGLLKCSKCGSYYISLSATGRTGQKFFYYHCSRSKQKLGCDTPAVSATAFDKALIQYFKVASQDRELIVKAIGDAILDAQVKLEKLEKTIKEHDKELDAVKGEAKKLLDLAVDGAIAQSAVFKTKMEELDREILKLEDRIAKLQAKKNAAQMSANSGEFLHSNIRFAMQYIDKAPPDAQKSLLRALVKEIVVHARNIEIHMYVAEPPAGTMSGSVPVSACDIKQKRSTVDSEAPSNQDDDSSGCLTWLPGQDTNRIIQSKSMSELIPYYYRTFGRSKKLVFGKKPAELPKNKAITKKEMRSYENLKSYVNPIQRAREYRDILVYEDITQTQLAQRLSISRARITQVLNLLKLPEEKQEQILINGKSKKVTERMLRQLSSNSTLEN